MTHYFARLWAALCGKPYWGDEEDALDWDCDEFEEYEPEWERKPFNQRIAGLNELISIADYKGPTRPFSLDYMGNPVPLRDGPSIEFVLGEDGTFTPKVGGQSFEPVDLDFPCEIVVSDCLPDGVDAMLVTEDYLHRINAVTLHNVDRPHNDDAHDDTWPHAARQEKE